jgi:hypothetical protein
MKRVNLFVEFLKCGFQCRDPSFRLASFPFVRSVCCCCAVRPQNLFLFRRLDQLAAIFTTKPPGRAIFLVGPPRICS